MFRRCSARRSVQGLLCLVILISFLPIFILLSKQKAAPYFVQEHPYFHYDLDLEEPRNFDQKCLIPRLHPFDPSIWSYLSSQRSIICKSRTSDLIYIDINGRLRYNNSGVQLSGYKVDKSLFCYWSSVKRGGVNADDDDSVVYGKQVLLGADGIQLPGDSDFIRVQCKNFAKITVYDKIHAYIRNASKPTEEPSSRNRINVLIFGIDSLSRLAFIRYLPKTYRYLTENLKMTVFRGMNKIGDNTYPNLVALLTGREAYGGNLPDESKGFDEWPLIWKNYSSAGYATMWAEDFASFGLFNYLAKGFRRPPTLHYLRPFWLAVEESSLLKISSHMCYGSIPKHKLQMDYVRNFVSTYQKKMIPYFGFSFLAEISHEYLYRVTAADEQFEEFFKFLNDGNFLNDTVLIVMSDHGHRFDAIRTTQVGAIEERMPFFAIHIPKSIASLQPEIMDNFAINKGRLVTPFDTHATLSDILNRAVTGQPLGQSPPPEGCLGQSLFAPVPANRTCSRASIPDHYCVCETESAILVSDTRAMAAAKAMINRINEMLFKGERTETEQCVPLTLGAIRSAHIVHRAEEKDPDQNSLTKVRVMIEAEPSKGIFEATVLVGDVAVEVLGDVSRINVYGQQSSCIKHIILRKYCFCSKYLYNSKTDPSKENL